MIDPRYKDLIYRTVPLPVLQMALPRVAPGKSPFLPPIIARRAIFIHVPKAAGTSLKIELYGAATGGHRTIGEYMAYDGARTRDFLKFCFVRNPWDRLLSAYSYLKQGQRASMRDKAFAARFLSDTQDINEFVLSLQDRALRRQVMVYDHFRPQSHWICLPGAKTHAMDFIGRFETLEEDTNRVREMLSLPLGGVEKIRPSDHAPYREAYTAQARRIVADLYAQDIALLEYEF
ncbi:sulfotransferase family protein [Roseobacter sp. YSTF-M11]|uniref:Sulfotransferase family protein n=1 Tax=Roseobacter insulae TaxID=2859783 RepID=A0A9X1G1D5_9RHOB|nr:sulfotransferase family protein [Roseobacter insulae]MBW4710783.1 sulfotransferase family protein [Roseobacter insulae]